MSKIEQLIERAERSRDADRDYEYERAMEDRCKECDGRGFFTWNSMEGGRDVETELPCECTIERWRREDEDGAERAYDQWKDNQN